MKRTLPVVFLFTYLLLSFCQVVIAQKVALVLSGGGSRGAAHIGVIRALEENHIPIDCIAGTSIGAIIGGLYAIGYSPDEMEAFLSSKEFNRIITGNFSEKYSYFYRKEEPNASWINFDFNLKKKLTSQLPTNLISPYEMDFKLLEMLAPASAASGYNFDRLMVPFRCVVADVDSSKPVTLRNGDLGSAVRGSMSIPFIFKPVMVNGRLFFDGGMYDNFPVDVAMKEFHPDIIIGSRVAERYHKPDREDILSQIQSMLMERQNDTISYPHSVLITPAIPDINIISFSRIKELADSGYHAALKKIGEIRKMVHKSENSELLVKKREEFKKKQPPVVFDSIYITGLNPTQSKYLRRTLKHGHNHVQIDDLQKEYFHFIDEGFIKGIFPVAHLNRKTGFYDLYLDVQKSDNFNIQFGGNISLGASNEGFLQIQYRYLWTKALHFTVNGYFGKFYNSAKVGTRIDFNSIVPWFIDATYTLNHFNYFRNTTYFFDDKIPSYLMQSEYFGKISSGFPLINHGKFTIGITGGFTNSKYYQFNIFSRLDTSDQTSFNFLSPGITFELNSLNRKQYANAGAKLLLSFSYTNGEEKFLPGSTTLNKHEINQDDQWVQLRILWDNYFKSLGPFKFGFYAEGFLSNQPLFLNYISSILYAPEFNPVPEMRTLCLPSFRANNYASAGLKMVLRIYKKIEFRLEGYLFQPYKAILENPADRTAYYGKPLENRSFLGSTAIVYNTFLGPVSIGVNYYEKSVDPFSLYLNFGYILFNKRALE
ncbi:MAG: patatin-like phospholipase family protein [Bacteroidetes bacterium]|nr:patatin-like phospholipase family protein [Bacteroidota bacterium]